MTKVLELWETHCIGKTNVIYERYKFNNRSQEQTESIDAAYVNALRALAESCDFLALKDQLISDRIVCGVRDNALRRKSLQESKLALEKCVDICRAAKAVQLKKIAPNQQQQHSSEVDLVTQGYSWKSKARKESVKGPKNHQLGECKFCGRKHERRRGKYPAYGPTCSSCGKPYHFVVKCESTTSDSKRPPQKSKRRKVHQLADSDDASCSSEEETLSVSTENAANSVEMTDYKSKIFAHMEVAGALVKMQVDSGGSCNVLSRKLLPKDPVIDRADVKLTTYSKASFKVLDVTKVQLRNPKNQKKYRVEFVVTKDVYTPLVGSVFAQKMGPITVKQENILNVTGAVDKPDFEGLSIKEINATYSDVFKGLGCMEGKLHLELDEKVTPEIMPPRRVPLSLRDRLKQELTRLEKEHVIIKEEDPTDWVSSLVVTEKPNGKLHVCIDPQHLNRALKRSCYPLPVIEHVLPALY